MFKGNSMCEDNVIKRWDDTDQHDLCLKALRWLGYKGTEMEQFCFKSTQMIIQRGIKSHGDKGRESAMKEIKNLRIKTRVFHKQKLTQ